MTVYLDKRRGVWRYDFWLNGTRHVDDCRDTDGQPVTSRSAAQRAQEAARVAARNRPGVSLKTPIGYTLGLAFADWLDTIEGTANHGNAEDHIAEFLKRPEFAPDKLVTEVTLKDIEAYVGWAKKQPLMIWIAGPDRERAAKLPPERRWKVSDPPRFRSPSTINRYLATLRSALQRCTKLRDPVTGHPLLPSMPPIQDLKTVKRLPRPVPDDGLAQALEQAPPHLVRAALICRLMGFRRTEALGLLASRMDDQNRGYWLPGDQTKGKRDEFVPANEQAWALLCQLRDEAQAAGMDHLILYYPRGEDAKPRPVKSVKRSWKTAMKAAGLDGQHTFHNLKASYVTAIARVASGPTTQGLARHSNYETTKRYLAVVDEDKRNAVENMPAPAIAIGAPTAPSPTPKSHTARKSGHLRRVK